MFSFLKRMREAKLYKQWVEKSGLSPEDIPADLMKNKNETVESVKSINSEVDLKGSYDLKRLQYGDSVLLRLRIRYIFIMGFLIATLLVALSVVSTILIMQSC